MTKRTQGNDGLMSRQGGGLSPVDGRPLRGVSRIIGAAAFMSVLLLAQGCSYDFSQFGEDYPDSATDRADGQFGPIDPTDGGLLPRPDGANPITPLTDAGVPMTPENDARTPDEPSADAHIPDDPSTDAGPGPGPQDAGTNRDAGSPDPADAGPVVPLECDPPGTLFEQNGCTGCHGPTAQGGLDLRRNDLEGLFVNTRSQAQGCQDRLLIDPNQPERSLLLQVVGAVPQPAGDACDIEMPNLAPADEACLVEWVEDIASGYVDEPDAFVATPLHSSLQKVKTLLNGGALTQAEYDRVAGAADEEEAMRTLYRSWAQGEAFDTKMMAFFKVNLQQLLQAFETDQFNRLRGQTQTRNQVRRIMEESFVRTALHIINSDQPFTQVARTQTWMVTTANLVLLLYGDQTAQERARTHTVFSRPQGRPTGLRQQISRRAWFLDQEVIGECEIEQRDVLNFLLGDLNRRDCENHTIPRNRFRIGLDETHLTEEDFNDWRLVELSYQPNAGANERTAFYDLYRLRRANSVVTRIPRVGFFSTNAFFENWATNVDNQFRVSVNQSLLAGLHIGFNASERAQPFDGAPIDGDHAVEECYGCHKNLDPMRAYFSRSFNVRYQRPYGDGESARLLGNAQPSFAFRGRRNRGGDLRRFGRLIAEHPNFPKAWIQKLCHYANSARCNESEPRFRQLVNRFRNNDFNFKEAMIELFASPLVSQRAALQQSTAEGLVSISRRSHLCALLSQRTGRANLCEVRRISQIIGLIPEDGFARGIVEPTQAVRPSPIYLAAAEAVCQATAITVVNRSSQRFPVNQPARAVANMVSYLMALDTQPARAVSVAETLTAHFDAARGQGAGAQDALRSTFTAACLSPDVMGIGL